MLLYFCQHEYNSTDIELILMTERSVIRIHSRYKKNVTLFSSLFYLSYKRELKREIIFIAKVDCYNQAQSS